MVIFEIFWGYFPGGGRAKLRQIFVRRSLTILNIFRVLNYLSKNIAAVCKKNTIMITERASKSKIIYSENLKIQQFCPIFKNLSFFLMIPTGPQLSN